MRAKVIQICLGAEFFSFTVGQSEIVSIEVVMSNIGSVEFTILIKEPEAKWRHFTHSGNYLIEWER